MVLSNEDKMKLFSRLLNYEKKNAAAAGSVRKTTTRSRKRQQPSRKRQQPSRKPASIRSKSRSKAQTNKKVHDLASVGKRQRPTQQPSRKRQRSSAAVSTNTTAASYQKPQSQVVRPVQVLNRSTVARGAGSNNIDIMVDEE